MAKTVYHHERQVTRAELVADLQRVAAELESRRQLVFGGGEVSEHLDVPDTVDWGVDIKRTDAGAVVELRIEFAVPDSAAAPAPRAEPDASAPGHPRRAPSARPGPL